MSEVTKSVLPGGTAVESCAGTAPVSRDGTAVVDYRRAEREAKKAREEFGGEKHQTLRVGLAEGYPSVIGYLVDARSRDFLSAAVRDLLPTIAARAVELTEAEAARLRPAAEAEARELLAGIDGAEYRPGGTGSRWTEYVPIRDVEDFYAIAENLVDVASRFDPGPELRGCVRALGAVVNAAQRKTRHSAESALEAEKAANAEALELFRSQAGGTGGKTWTRDEIAGILAAIRPNEAWDVDGTKKMVLAVLDGDLALDDGEIVRVEGRDRAATADASTEHPDAVFADEVADSVREVVHEAGVSPELVAGRVLRALGREDVYTLSRRVAVLEDRLDDCGIYADRSTTAAAASPEVIPLGDERDDGWG